MVDFKPCFIIHPYRRKKSAIFSRPADHTATLALPPNVVPSAILEGEVERRIQMLRYEFTEQTSFQFHHQAGYLISGGEGNVILGQVDQPIPSSIFKSKDIKKTFIVLWTSLLSLVGTEFTYQALTGGSETSASNIIKKGMCPHFNAGF